ncbi:hypothetical protein JXM67_15320 [candidate division WOR-3 bacterium]|nr:hypothetical protein [candidate division WOR-3 bacterium]
MSTRFNRNDSNVPDDRLFAADFQVDQNGQDADLLQIVKDLGCLPCMGSGLEVSEKVAADHSIEISAGWCYDVDGHRITVESVQEKTLVAWDETVNYVLIAWTSVTDTPRNAHRTGVEYQSRKKDSFTITVTTSAPGVSDIVLATVTQDGVNSMDISVDTRIVTSCKLIAQTMIPAVAEEQGTGTGAEPPPAGQQYDLPDLPKGKVVPMPIILSGTRDGEAWNGVETILPEELGRTTEAINAFSLERVAGKSGTPLADVKVWFGDWGAGQRDGVDTKKCNFTMPTKSGVSAWDADLWITDPPGEKKYYLVKSDESWYSLVNDSGSNWVTVEDDLPDADSHTFYVCPYADRYRSQAIPYQTDSALNDTHPFHCPDVIARGSPVPPLVIIKDLNQGGKYRLKVTSVISGDNYTKWAEADYVVGTNLVKCWEPSVSYITAVAVDGGVQITIPGPTGGTTLPAAYEICYTYGPVGSEIPDPDFNNPEHPTIRVSERVFKLDVPPGNAVKVAARAISSRIVMRCSGTDKILLPQDAYVIAGGVSLRRNRKQITGIIYEEDLAVSSAELADQAPLANPIWPEKIMLFNPTPSYQEDFEVYIHGSNQPYTDGRKIEIAVGGDQDSISSKGSAEITISDYRITDPALKVTIKNIDTEDPQTFELRYGVQYREDSENEIGK